MAAETDVPLSENRDRRWVFALGVITALIGVCALWMAALTTQMSVVMIGAFLLVGGCFQLFYSMTAKRWGSFALHLTVAILYVVLGLLYLANPLMGAEALTVALGAFLITGGLFRMALSVADRFAGWGWTAVSGLISLLLGALILHGWPVTSLFVLGVFVGVDLVFVGSYMIVVALARQGAIPASSPSESAPRAPSEPLPV